MIFHATIQQGRTIWEDPKKVAQFIDKVEGKRIVIEIKQWRAKRSNNQNRWYWGCIIPLLGEHFQLVRCDLPVKVRHCYLSCAQTCAHGKVPASTRGITAPPLHRR